MHVIDELDNPSAGRGERGAILVFFALFAPLVVLLLIFVIDVDNWLEHQRHLQVQADASALAAAQSFQPCSDSSIYSTAGQYGGAASVMTPGGATVGTQGSLYNGQVGNTSSSNIHELINSTTFYNQSSTSSPHTPDDTTAAPPCSPGTNMIDVKLTETNLPWYFRPFTSVPYIDAHARVSLLQQTTDTGGLPVAVNDLNPKAVEAYFINEATGQQLGSTPLAAIGTNAAGQAVWANSGTTPTSQPLAFTVNTAQIGVRIAITGKSSLTGTMSTDCSTTLVICYDATSSSIGPLHIQGYTGGTGSASAPALGQVTLAGQPGAGGCSDGYFSEPAVSCAVGVSANVDFGTTTRPSKAEVDAIVNGKCYGLTFQSTAGTTELWSAQTSVPSSNTCTGFKNNAVAGTGFITLAAGSGQTPIDLQIADSATTKTCANAATLCGVQKSYTGDIAGGTTHSGPIQGAFISEVGGVSQDADSFRSCATCSHNLIVTLDITGTLQDAQSTADPVYTLRFDGTGSQNQSVSCSAANGGSTFADELASGCLGTWAINPTLTCPDTSSDCVPPATGNKQNQVAKGMNQRVLGSTKPSTCTAPNHWPSFTFTNGIPNVSPTDPRVVTLFITPYGSFGGSGGSSLFPIADFATFYVTGWQDNGNGFNNPCQGRGDDTAAGGTIVGHFIKYINTLNTNSGGGSGCVLSSLGACVAVLTR